MSSTEDGSISPMEHEKELELMEHEEDGDVEAVEVELPKLYTEQWVESALAYGNFSISFKIRI